MCICQVTAYGDVDVYIDIQYTDIYPYEELFTKTR